MEFEPREWGLLEKSARNLLMMHAQIDALSAMLRADLVRLLGSQQDVEHLHVLDHLCRDGDGTDIGTIARALKWPRTTLSRVMARLIAAGLVEVAVFDDDARRRTIWLTEAGHRSRVLLLEAVAMALMKVETHLRATKIASLREETAEMVRQLEKLQAKPRKRRR